MMHPSRRAVATAALALLTGVALSCSSGADNVMGNNGALVLEPGLNLLADPMVIILDPNDANAPRDPSTQELIGSTALSAIVLGSDLSPTVDDTVTFTATDGILASGGQKIATDSAGLAPDTLSVTESGPSLITVTAATATETKTLDIIVDIAPVADAGDDQTVYCPTPVTLDGSGSTDANSTAGTNDDITSFEWFEGQTKIADGEVAQVDLAVGIHAITLQVTDKAGATATDDVTITVVDTTPPVVTLHMSPDYLWPPNHKMKNVHAILDIQDCDPAPTVELVSVTSNEPANGLGDGDTSPDISGASLGTDDRDVKVRAERSGTGSGRVYTFVYRVTDASGNFTDATATVTVPHDQGH
jgi:hypothetical protein